MKDHGGRLLCYLNVARVKTQTYKLFGVFFALQLYLFNIKWMVKSNSIIKEHNRFLIFIYGNYWITKLHISQKIQEIWQKLLQIRILHEISHILSMILIFLNLFAKWSYFLLIITLILLYEWTKFGHFGKTLNNSYL